MKPIGKLLFGEGGLGKVGVAARNRRQRRPDAEPQDFPKKPRLKKREGARHKGRLSDFEPDNDP
jgi:hypothetical protein